MLAVPLNEVNLRLAIYLAPFIPLSMIWMYIPIMRGKIKKEGFALLDTPLANLITRRGGYF